ncbi:unnamed protein product [Cylindrotheca closterium]|uniref:Palmitoyltransferase n=1 Tax=Cylindrotheca closterium TaxID=2856 RepID=A0AAD2PWM4_9STRA|nr:unnamed protein product [Cylindrotheca closterium]
MPASSQSQPSNNTPRRSFVICGERFYFPGDGTDALIHIGTVFIEKAVLVLGPMLITFASVIIGGLSYTYFTIIMPMLEHKYGDNPESTIMISLHTSIVVFFVAEISFNYFMCVVTRNKGANYDRVVRELADATNFQFPENPQELESYRRDTSDKMNLRMKQRYKRQQEEQAPPATVATGGADSDSNNIKHRKNKMAPANNKNNKVAAAEQPMSKLRSWMLMAPDEWGYCARSHQPKPPRAHYDHVSKTLVLCLDHYCPWMFNVVGYFNYRYFCNFLWFVELAMIYGAFITYEPFLNTSGRIYRAQRDQFRKTNKRIRMFPMVPFSDERLKVSLSFMLCLSIGIAVACLGGFHLYLCLTGQTTIEFHGNWVNRRKAHKLNKKWKNPYDMGLKRNWQQVYGSGNPLLAFLIPSCREPEFLPLPLPEEKGRRIWARTKYDKLPQVDNGESEEANAGGDIV